jgi:hypothetical protein
MLRIEGARTFEHPIETCDIASQLEKLGRCHDVLSKQTIDACIQGAYLLRGLRSVVFSDAPTSEIVTVLKDMVANQGDG